MTANAGPLDDGPSEPEVPDLTEIAARAEGHFQPHPLFPKDDGIPEDRDIRYVSFLRRRPGDSPKYGPDEFPADEVTSWSQVHRWWGGGSYKAVAKDKNHQFIRTHPRDRETWVEMEGDSKPLLPVRGEAGLQSQGAAVPPPVAAPAPPPGPPSPAVVPIAPAPAPSSVEALMVVMTELVREVRAIRGAPQPPPPPSNDNSVMVAMIEANARVAAAKAEADGRAAAAQADANARQAENNMKLVLSLIGQRNEAPAAPAAAPADSTKVALDLLGAMRNMVKEFQPPAPVAAPPAPTWQEHVNAFKTLRELTGGGAPPSEFQPLVDLLGPVIAAEAAKTGAAREPARPERAPRGRLEYVPDVGMVEVVAPERRPEAPRRNIFDEVAEVAQRDPHVRARLLRAIQGPPAPPTSAAPASRPDVPPAAPVAAVLAVEPAPSVPVPNVPELDASPPQDDRRPSSDPPAVAAVPVADPPSPFAAPVKPPAEVVRVEPDGALGSSPAMPPRTALDAEVSPNAPPVSSLGAESVPPPEPIDAAEYAVPSPSPAPSTPVPVPTVPAAPPFVFEPADRKRAENELIRIKELGREARVAALRRIPGVGAMAEDVARAMESIPREAMATMLPHLQPDTLQMLAGKDGGAGG